MVQRMRRGIRSIQHPHLGLHCPLDPVLGWTLSGCCFLVDDKKRKRTIDARHPHSVYVCGCKSCTPGDCRYRLGHHATCLIVISKRGGATPQNCVWYQALLFQRHTTVQYRFLERTPKRVGGGGGGGFSEQGLDKSGGNKHTRTLQCNCNSPLQYAQEEDQVAHADTTK